MVGMFAGRRTRLAVAAVAVTLIIVAGDAGLVAAPAGADVAPQRVDGSAQVHWRLAVDVLDMEGTYATSSQLGQGTVQVGISANFGGSIGIVLVRSDGMRMTGSGSYGDLPNLVVNLSGALDIQSASLTLTQLSRTTDPDNPSTGTATYGVQGLLSPADNWSPSTTTTSAATTTSPTISSSTTSDPATTLAPLGTTKASSSVPTFSVAPAAHGQQSLPKTGAPTSPVGLFALSLILVGAATARSRGRSRKV